MGMDLSRLLAPAGEVTGTELGLMGQTGRSDTTYTLGRPVGYLVP